MWAVMASMRPHTTGTTSKVTPADSLGKISQGQTAFPAHTREATLAALRHGASVQTQPQDPAELRR